MARFDVYAGLGAGDGYVVDVQAPLLDQLGTRVVIPLLPAERVSVIRNLNPVAPERWQDVFSRNRRRRMGARRRAARAPRVTLPDCLP